MKVLYDSKSNACAVEFDADDCIFASIHEGKLHISSGKGGKPEIVEQQLLFSSKEATK